MSSPLTTSGPLSPEASVVLDPSEPSFLNHLSSIYAHSDSPPFTATFTHSIPGPAHGVRSDCYWYPPKSHLSLLDVSEEVGESEEEEWDAAHTVDGTGGALHFSADFDSTNGGRSGDTTGGVRGSEQRTARARLQLVIDPEQSPRQAPASNVEPPPKVTILILVPGKLIFCCAHHVNNGSLTLLRNHFRQPWPHPILSSLPRRNTG